MTDDQRRSDDELDAAFDAFLSNRLKTALDDIGPSQEAQDRMLANLLAAQVQKASAQAGTEATAQATVQAAVQAAPEQPRPAEGFVPPATVSSEPSASAADKGFVVVPGKASRRRSKASWRWIVAMAASITVVAFSLSIVALMGRGDKIIVHQGPSETVVTDEGSTGGDVGRLNSVSGGTAIEGSNSDENSGTEEGDPDEQQVSYVLSSLGGPLTDQDDPSYPYAMTYQNVQFENKKTGTVAMYEGKPLTVDEKWVTESAGKVKAVSPKGISVSCEAYYLSVGNGNLRAIQYDDGGPYILVEMSNTSS